MPQKLETVLKHVEEISNDINRQLIYEINSIDELFIIFLKFNQNC